MIFSKVTYEEDSLFLVSGSWLFTTQVSCRETPLLTLEAETLPKAAHSSPPHSHHREAGAGLHIQHLEKH